MLSNPCRSSPALIYMLSVMYFNPGPKEPFPRSEFTPALYLDILDADRSPNAADSPRSSPDRLITMVKVKKNRKTIVPKNAKQPERPRRSVKNIDKYVINYACEDACVKVANVKSVKNVHQGGGGGGGGGGGASKCPQEHLRVPSYCAGKSGCDAHVPELVPV